MDAKRNTLDQTALLGFVERIEKINADMIDPGKEDIKVILAEARAFGFLPKGVAMCVKVRAKTPRQHEEDEELRDLYLHGIGMAEEPPLFRQLDAMAGQKLGREALIEGLKELVPTKGEITVKMDGAAPLRLWRDSEGKAHSEEVHPTRAPSAQSPGAPGSAPARARQDVPDCDDAGATELGRAAAKDNKAIITNPFPFGDARRPKFDEGWRRETGNDGFGPQ
jgi:uncharacterized protein (UPF0335 family)